MLLDRIARMSPQWVGRPLSIGSSVLALAGASFVFAATVYGSWLTLIPAAAAFVIAATCWQLADRIAGRGH